MPIYEFQCLDCRQTFEVRRCFSDADQPATCQKCESHNTKKIAIEILCAVFWSALIKFDRALWLRWLRRWILRFLS
jgi:putative FmdB family regulatory protein